MIRSSRPASRASRVAASPYGQYLATAPKLAWGPAGPSVFAPMGTAIDVVRDKSWDPMPHTDAVLVRPPTGTAPLSKPNDPPANESFKDGYWSSKPEGGYEWKPIPPPPVAAGADRVGFYEFNRDQGSWDYNVLTSYEQLESKLKDPNASLQFKIYDANGNILPTQMELLAKERQAFTDKNRVSGWDALYLLLVPQPVQDLLSFFHVNDDLREKANNNLNRWALEHGFSKEDIDGTNGFLSRLEVTVAETWQEFRGQAVSEDDYWGRFGVKMLSDVALMGAGAAVGVGPVASMMAGTFMDHVSEWKDPTRDNVQKFVDLGKGLAETFITGQAAEAFAARVVPAINQALQRTAQALEAKLLQALQASGLAPGVQRTLVGRLVRSGVNVSDDFIVQVGSVTRNPQALERATVQPGRLALTDGRPTVPSTISGRTTEELTRLESQAMSFRMIDDMAAVDRRALFNQSVQGAPERVRFAVNRVSPSPNDFILLDQTGTQLFRDGNIAWSNQAENVMLQAFQELGIPPARLSRLDLTSTRSARPALQRVSTRSVPSVMQIPGPTEVTALPQRVAVRRLPSAMPELTPPQRVNLRRAPVRMQL